jgi:DNA-binding NtrC family response regulator
MHDSDQASPDGFSETPRSEASKVPSGTPVQKSALDAEFEHFLAEALEQSGASDDGPPSLRAWLDLAEAWKIMKTLRECRGNRSAAARALGIGRRTLYAKMDKLQIEPRWAMAGRAAGK